MTKYLVLCPEHDYELLMDSEHARKNLNDCIVDAEDHQSAIIKRFGEIPESKSIVIAVSDSSFKSFTKSAFA